MKNIIALILVSILGVSCQHSFRNPSADGGAKEFKSKDFKAHFKNLNPEERKSVLSRSRVLDENYKADDIKKINIADMYQNVCGPDYKYEKITTEKGKTTFKWPIVQCTYHQDDMSLSGATAKFLCDFEDRDKKDGTKTRKVKYSRNGKKANENSDIVDGTIATTLTRLIGFYAETYCPAEVVCKNCPSQSPWDQQKSSSPPSDKTFTFPTTFIEYPLKGYTVTTPGPHEKPEGMHWDELRNIDGGELSTQMRIEREAWMLWVGVVQHWDADPHNQRILCLQAGTDANGNPICEKPVIYTHDYGRSFYRNFQFTLWSLTKPMKEDSKGCYSNFGKMIFNGNPGPGLVQFPHISSEARDLLVSRLSRVTDQQLMEVFQFAKGEEIIDVPSIKWMKAFREKITQLKEANCQPFASGKSALGK